MFKLNRELILNSKTCGFWAIIYDQIKASEKQEKSQRALVAEKVRHCEAMEEEIEELNR